MGFVSLVHQKLYRTILPLFGLLVKRPSNSRPKPQVRCRIESLSYRCSTPFSLSLGPKKPFDYLRVPILFLLSHRDVLDEDYCQVNMAVTESQTPSKTKLAVDTVRLLTLNILFWRGDYRSRCHYCRYSFIDCRLLTIINCKYPTVVVRPTTLFTPYVMTLSNYSNTTVHLSPSIL